MYEFLMQAFLSLLVIMLPLSAVPVYIGLTHQDSPSHRAFVAKKACLVSLVMLLSFAIFGGKLLEIMGVSQSAFRIGGGILLILSSIKMVMQSPSKPANCEEAKDDVAVFPLAIPLIAGPGALTTIVVLMRQAKVYNITASLVISLYAFIMIAIVYIALRLSDKIIKLIGFNAINIMVRVSGIVLNAIGVQYIITGIKEAMIT